MDLNSSMAALMRRSGSHQRHYGGVWYEDDGATARALVTLLHTREDAVIDSTSPPASGSVPLNSPLVRDATDRPFVAMRLTLNLI